MRCQGRWLALLWALGAAGPVVTAGVLAVLSEVAWGRGGPCVCVCVCIDPKRGTEACAGSDRLWLLVRVLCWPSWLPPLI